VKVFLPLSKVSVAGTLGLRPTAGSDGFLLLKLRTVDVDKQALLDVLGTSYDVRPSATHHNLWEYVLHVDLAEQTVALSAYIHGGEMILTVCDRPAGGWPLIPGCPEAFLNVFDLWSHRYDPVSTDQRLKAPPQQVINSVPGSILRPVEIKDVVYEKYLSDFDGLQHISDVPIMLVLDIVDDTSVIRDSQRCVMAAPLAKCLVEGEVKYISVHWLTLFYRVV
jgi:hypothetical protein